LDKVDDRIRSRMLDWRLCTIFAITAPAYNGGPRPETRKSTRRGKAAR
jgi:hypothetical protein